MGTDHKFYGSSAGLTENEKTPDDHRIGGKPSQSASKPFSKVYAWLKQAFCERENACSIRSSPHF